MSPKTPAASDGTRSRFAGQSTRCAVRRADSRGQIGASPADRLSTPAKNRPSPSEEGLLDEVTTKSPAADVASRTTDVTRPARSLRFQPARRDSGHDPRADCVVTRPFEIPDSLVLIRVRHHEALDDQLPARLGRCVRLAENLTRTRKVPTIHFGSQSCE
jgi:hypothetical protein